MCVCVCVVVKVCAKKARGSHKVLVLSLFERSFHAHRLGHVLGLTKDSPPYCWSWNILPIAKRGWHGAPIVFNNRNPLEDCKYLYFFHWMNSLNKLITKYVVQGFKKEHKQLCTQWRCAKLEEDATNLFRKIRGWWTSEKVVDANIPYMECWLSWWHVRYPRWRKHFTKVS